MIKSKDSWLESIPSSCFTILSRNILIKHKEVSTLIIAAVYIGTIVGAGFSSGQEVTKENPVSGVFLFENTWR
ncbi:MAG: hypothetical protein A4E53_00574 [Pelotomaculum sp. PtaB.Bin104]|nr:MAG: hypothetical protein A4E53_00574 [Pelotomaculum sp. PtaB.Bin104]